MVIRKLASLALAFLFTSATIESSARAEDPKQEARIAFETAVRYFDAEEYKAALPYFKKAYELSGKRAATVFALAQCERSLELYADAIAHFKEYVNSQPTPDNAGEVRETIALLEDIHAKNEASARIERDKKAAEEERLEKERKAEAERLRIEARTTIQREADAVRQKEEAEAKKREAERKKNEELARQATAQQAPIAKTEDDSSIFTSGYFWVPVGLVLAGGGAALGVWMMQKSPDYYGGTSGVVIQP